MKFIHPCLFLILVGHDQIWMMSTTFSGRYKHRNLLQEFLFFNQKDIPSLIFDAGGLTYPAIKSTRTVWDRFARKPGDENPFVEANLFYKSVDDCFSKRVWSPGEASHSFLCSYFDWFRNLEKAIILRVMTFGNSL